MLLFLLQACTPYLLQAPSVTLDEVHRNGAHRVAFDRHGRRLASGGLHGGVKVWSVADGSELQAFRDHRAAITGLAWVGPDRLLSADRAGLLLVRDLAQERVVVQRDVGRIDRVAVAADAGWLLLLDDVQVTRLRLPDLQAVARYRPDAMPLAVAIDGVSQRVALSTDDGRLMLLNPVLEPQAELQPATRDAHTLAFSPDGNILLGGAWFRLLVWNLQSGTLEERATEHLGKINSVAISPDGAHWASLGRETDSNLRLVDAQSNAVLRRFKAHHLCGQEARFSPDGRYLASSSDDGSVYIYDLAAPYAPQVPYLHND